MIWKIAEYIACYIGVVFSFHIWHAYIGMGRRFDAEDKKSVSLAAWLWVGSIPCILIDLFDDRISAAKERRIAKATEIEFKRIEREDLRLKVFKEYELTIARAQKELDEEDYERISIQGRRGPNSL